MLIDIQNLYKAHPAPLGGAPLPILKNLDFSLAEGATAAIVGPSGSGKSTLLNIVGALDRADSGSIRVNGQDLGQLNENELADYRLHSVGFVFQMHHLLPQCSVLENVLAPSLVKPRQIQKSTEERARTLLDSLGLAHRLQHRPAELSGGEKQRVAVARAMAGNPKLLLADEPTGALDRHTASHLGEILLELNRSMKVALLVVTHSLDLARQLEQVYELRDGKLERIS
ncbi:MAG: hypothetical protein RLZZ399_76 [Verrucomicrobiota bacterium]|jgi:ABC-type lipoprotein export system ATPase subunit